MTISQSELDALISGISNPEERYFKGTLYGEFQMRKTTTALRCMQPNTRSVLLHVDKSWQVIHNHPDEFKERVIPVRYEGLSQVRSLLAAVLTNTPPFDNVSLIAWDTVSQAQEEYVDFLMENASWNKSYREKAVPSKPGVRFEAQEIPGGQDYHLAKNKMRPIVSALIDAPIDVMFTAHVRDPSYMNPDDILRRPSITEALYKVIARDSTFVGYCYKDTRKKGYYIDFSPTNKLSAKSQIKSFQDTQIKADELPQHLLDWKMGI